MAFSEALGSRQCFYVSLFQKLELTLVDGHICDRGYRAEQCPSPDSAGYAKIDAPLDILEGPERRPPTVEVIEIHTIGAAESSYVRRAVELTPPVRAVARAAPHYGEYDVSGRVFVPCLSQ